MLERTVSHEVGLIGCVHVCLSSSFCFCLQVRAPQWNSEAELMPSEFVFCGTGERTVTFFYHFNYYPFLTLSY